MSFVKPNNWLKLVLASIGILWLSSHLNAQTYAVGNTSVSTNVGPLGNATANIPIYCPSGRLGIKPQVSLTFNSQANSGILGKGWNITGMSVISRSGSNWHLDNKVQETVNLNGNDKLTLDGQRLLLVQGSPTSFFTNGNVFRTEIDQFVKVVYKNIGGNEYFEVDTKDGGKVFYGYTANSKHKPVGSSNTLGWYITRSYDKNGNYMEYVYDNANGQILLKQIKYTGYDATFYGTKTSSIAQEVPFNKVVFEYESTAHLGLQFVNGEAISQNTRLNKIITYADATIARTYLMNYTSDEINSYLTKVTEQNGNGEQLKPVDITWTEDGGLERQIGNLSSNDTHFKATGDFNGDGKTDLLIINGILKPENGFYLSTNNHYEILNFSSGSTLVNTTTIATGNLPFNNITAVMVGDIDSDGDDDIVFQTYAYNYKIDYVVGGGTYYKLNYSVFRYWALKSNSDKQTNSFILTPNLDKNGLEAEIYPSKTIYASGAFAPQTNYFYKLSNIKPMLVEADGDGFLDLLEFKNTSVSNNHVWPNDYDIGVDILLSNKGEDPTLGNRYFSSVTNFTKVLNIIPMDFNGNGKTDFMFVFDENNGTHTYSYSAIWEISTNGQLTSIYSSQFPTKSDKFLDRGDFNGDGKSDLLYFLDNKWMIAYSKGNDYEKYNATSLWFSHNYHPEWCGGEGLTFQVSDMNGDGKDDIIERHYHINSNHPSHTLQESNIYYSKGFGFKKVNMNGTSNQLNNILIFYDRNKIKVGDFNGNGKLETVLFSTISDDFIVEEINNYSSKLTKIAYSNLHSYNFTYQSLSADNGSVYARTNTTYIGKSVSIKPAMYVVNTFNIKVNGLVDKTTKYEYADLLYNKHGRGLLGFVKTTAIDETTNGVTNINKTIAVNEFKLNDADLFKLDLWRTRVHLVPNGAAASLTNMVSQTILTNYSLNPIANNFDIRFFYNNSTVETNYVTGLKKTTCIEYNEDGNLVFSQEVFDKIANATGVPEFTNTSRFEYNQHGSWLPSSLTIRKNCKIRKGITPHYTQTEMAYWANGNLKHTEYFKNNLSYYYKEMVNYDKYGNITNTSVDTANNATTNTFKNQYFTYTNGRFLQKVKNALNQETQFVYEPVYGNKTSEQGPSGLTTTYQYDNWGKLTRTDFPDGNFEAISFNWATTNTDNIYYYTIKSNSLGNMSWEYYNALDQKVRYEEKGFEGQIATQKFTYNSDNLPETETNLYNATNNTTITNTKKTTEYTYDKYKRKETVKYNNVLLATSIYTYGTTRTTIKDGKNREKYTILNATGLVETSGDNGGTISYKYGSHNQVLETTTNGNTIFTTYNVQLNKISMTDPNTGTILYDYNAFGELIGQKNAKDFIYYYKYDELGRLTQKWGGNDVYSYTYYSTLGNASINQLQKEEFKISGISKHKKEYTYTALGKLSSVAETVNNQVYTTNYGYKTTNQQLLTVGYPTGIILTYDYDNFNNLKRIISNLNGIIWTKNSEAIDGKLTSESFGNGFTTNYGYDTHRQLSQINSTKSNTSLIAFMANYSFELQTGNLLSRNYNNINGIEVFGYDNLDRLTQIEETINGITNTKTYDFANNGNITSIQNGGTHTLQYEDTKPHALTSHEFENNAPVMQPYSYLQHDYVYNSFDKLSHIQQSGYNSLDMEYGVDQQRINMRIFENGSPSVETYYINSANLEIKNGVSFTYLYAEGKPFAIYKVSNENTEMYYLHLDYQGSLMAITDNTGDIIENRSYDAWGRPRDPITWSYNIGMAFGGAGEGITMRGYTIHEHLEMFSLINMNGRLYDPVLGRMLSPDIFVQEQFNTQSFNRYSYCVNNPSKYSDKNGYWFGWDDIIVWGSAATTFLWDGGKAAIRTGESFLQAAFLDGGLDLTAPPSVRTNAWAKADPTANTYSGNAWAAFDPTTSGTKTNNALKIAVGYYMNAPWEAPQAVLGNIYSNFRNLNGDVTNVELGINYVLVNDKNDDRWGATLGVYINAGGIRKDYKHDPLFVHEFGHTIQSKLLGSLYLSKVAIPSAISGFLDYYTSSGHTHHNAWFEINANQFGQMFYDPQYTSQDEKNDPTSFSNIEWDWFLLFNPFVF